MPAKRYLYCIVILCAGLFAGYRYPTTAEMNREEVTACKKDKDIEKVIIEAINVGAPTYNGGNYLGCYRIYEGAAYKILFEYGSKCKAVKKQLKEAIDKSHENYSDSDKAWIMRMAFDKILGEPTIAAPPVKTNTL